MNGDGGGCDRRERRQRGGEAAHLRADEAGAADDVISRGLSALAASRDALRVERDEAQVERDVARDLLERVRRSRWGKIGRMLGLMPKE